MNTPYELTKDLTIKLLYNNGSSTGIACDKQLILQYQNFLAKMIRELPEVARYIKKQTTTLET